ncbi:alcohol dehydrogenase [Thozetella sp. PMI_491]|nr:alcohol dehydrogenase [Thozetella sp. PMI_491]
MKPAWLSPLLLAVARAGFTTQAAGKTYEYIVVGSGPGGGPLAADLARAGHSVLLLEAGDDQEADPIVNQIGSFNSAINNIKTRWDFFVKHSSDPERERRYLRLTWRLPDGTFYVGIDPPEGATELGVWYPRSGTLGGCAMHNAGLLQLPAVNDWELLVNATGDTSYSAQNMLQYLERLENCHYLPNGTAGHGFSGWMDSVQGDASWASSTANSPQGKDILRSIMAVSENRTDISDDDLFSAVKRDINVKAADRDLQTGVFGLVRHANASGFRITPNRYIKETLEDPADFSLDVQMNTLVTKVLFEEGDLEPRATGVEFLVGKSIYKGDPRNNGTEDRILGQAFASKEVIVSGGTFNSPQILMLSGIGPEDQLQAHGIPVIKHLPGVGANLGDNYEGGLIALADKPLVTAGGKFAIELTSSQSDGFRDIYSWCGNFSFEGFWPGFPQDYGSSQWTCAFVLHHPHSQAGTVELRSAEPTDVPEINFRLFEENEETDLETMLDAIRFIRTSLYGSVSQSPAGAELAPWTELHPCPGDYADGGTVPSCSDQEQKQYLKEQAYSHHASGTCKMGTRQDPMAVVDAKFRVFGVRGLRVVDASVFPRPPGPFLVLPTLMMSAKAADIILSGCKKLNVRDDSN